MNSLLKYILAGLGYLFFQVVLLNHMDILGVAIPFVFILFLFTLPFDTPQPVLYLTAFFMGLSVDILSETYATGLHTFSSLLAMGFRNRWVEIVSSSNFRNLGEISLANQSPLWYVSFLLPLIFIHHLAYFYLEAFTLAHFFFTLLKVVSSTLYTFFISFILCYIFYNR